jgi:hypothetical protein
LFEIIEKPVKQAAFLVEPMPNKKLAKSSLRCTLVGKGFLKIMRVRVRNDVFFNVDLLFLMEINRLNIQLIINTRI